MYVLLYLHLCACMYLSVGASSAHLFTLPNLPNWQRSWNTSGWT